MLRKYERAGSALDWRKEFCKGLDSGAGHGAHSYRLGSELRINLLLRRSDQKDANAPSPAKTAQRVLLRRISAGLKGRREAGDRADAFENK